MKPKRDHSTGAFIPPFQRCDCEGMRLAAEQREREIQQEREDLARQLHQDEYNRLMRKSMIPSRWAQRTFETFQVNDSNRSAYETALVYAENFNHEKVEGLIFTGTVGTGKTHLSAAIGMHLLNKLIRVTFGTVTNLLMQIRDSYGSEKITEWEVMNQFMKGQLLIIDDIGKEKVTEWTEQTLFEIINTRYENNRPTIITTNMSLSDLRAKYPNTGDAIVSRILEMCKGVKMNGPDWRKNSILRSE